MGTTRVSPDTLRQVAATVDRAYSRALAARDAFSVDAPGVGRGFGKASLEAQYDRSLTDALSMTDQYLALLRSYRDGLLAAADLYDQTDSAAGRAMRPA